MGRLGSGRVPFDGQAAVSDIFAALAVLVMATPQSPSAVEELRALARAGSDSALVERARQRPDDLRDALRRVLSDAAAGDVARGLPAGAPGASPAVDSVSAISLAAAARLARAYAVAWHDSFLVRQVSRFQSLSAGERRAKVEADSVRLAGNAALGSAGVAAAMRIWRESLRRFETLGDSAGMAAALGNLGAGFYVAREYDSAEAYLVRSGDLAERIGDYRTLGNAVGTLGSVSKDRGDLRRATELYARARPIRARTGDARGLAADQNNLGIVARELGDLPGARRAYEAALAANRSAGRAGPAATNLVNLGNVASLEGDYAEAAARYHEALATYRERGLRADAGGVLYNLGLLAMRRGDYRGAVAALAEGVGIYRGTGPVGDEIAARRSLANARAAMGDLQGARVELGRAEARAGRQGAGAGQTSGILAGLALAQGDLAVQFNRLAEAERHYGRAGRLARSAGDEESRAAAQQGIGLVMLLRESYARAQAALELALRAQDGLPDRRAAALTRLLIGYAARERGDTAAARRVLLQALDTLAAFGDAAGEAAALGALGDLEVEAGLPLTAESFYHRGLARLAARPAPGTAWQLHAGLAGALRSRGSLGEAAAQLRAAIGQVERVSAGLTLEERRAAFLADKWDVYVELAEVERARGRQEAAFEASERLRARQMLDLLARGRLAAGEASASSRDLATREQDLRRRIGELTRQLEAGGAAEPGLRGAAVSEEAGAVREALARSQDAYGELLLEMREARPEYAALIRGEVAPAREVMRALAPTEALLDYLVGDSTTTVFVLTRDTLAALDLNLSARSLAELVDFARGALASPTEGAARRAWRAPMRRLFQQLVAPVEASGLLAGKERLLIAPHAELHYLPFAALVRSGPPEQLLVERYVLEYVPSASVWVRLRQRPEGAAASGVLALAPRTDSLPGSRAEVAAIARIYGNQARVLQGAAASERAFRTLAPGHGIVHVASYGVLNKHNPLFSFVELGSGGGEDGRLEVHEVFGLDLEARLLVLSACQTGLGAGALADVPPGDDWVGLVQAFLFAGASNVLATLWPVEDVATATLMRRFYEALGAGRGEAEALALAQRSAARESRTAHPFYWAGFTLVRGR
jgi:CHAT domain-containing protein